MNATKMIFVALAIFVVSTEAISKSESKKNTNVWGLYKCTKSGASCGVDELAGSRGGVNSQSYDDIKYATYYHPNQTHGRGSWTVKTLCFLDNGTKKPVLAGPGAPNLNLTPCCGEDEGFCCGVTNSNCNYHEGFQAGGVPITQTQNLPTCTYYASTGQYMGTAWRNANCYGYQPGKLGCNRSHQAADMSNVCWQCGQCTGN